MEAKNTIHCYPSQAFKLGTYIIIFIAVYGTLSSPWVWWWLLLVIIYGHVKQPETIAFYHQQERWFFRLGDNDFHIDHCCYMSSWLLVFKGQSLWAKPTKVYVWFDSCDRTAFFRLKALARFWFKAPRY